MFDDSPRRSPESRPSRRQVLAAGAAAVAGVAGCAVPGQTETRRTSRTVDPGGEADLFVQNVNGDVTVADGADTVEIDVTKRTQFGTDLFQEATVESSVRGNQVRVETVLGDIPSGASVSVDLEITLPDGVAVDEVRTRNGDVRAEDVPGDATLRTNNGEAVADGVDGYVNVHSTNGDVRTRSVTGVAGAGTTNGEVDLEVPSIRDNLSVDNTNGGIRVAVPDDIDAEVELRTTNGDVSVAGLDVDVSTGRETFLRGTIGEGGDVISAETTNGDVRLRAL